MRLTKRGFQRETELKAKPSPAGATRIDPARRQMLRFGLAGAATAVSGSAFGQDGNWWQDVFRRDSASEPVQAKRSGDFETVRQLSDLRTSNIPWRSEEMLDNMDRAIARFRDLAKSGTWREIPSGRLIREGSYDERVPLIRARLNASGELSDSAARKFGNSIQYDAYLDSAVRRFQEAHGLRVTGFINQSTLAQLNVTPQQRLQQLQLNRRRIQRLVQGRIADRYVLVNAAAYQLEAVERFEVIRRHRVIVGKPDRQTPEIEARIEGLNFFPYWKVPLSVAVKDLIPKLIKDPGYLEEQHIRPVAEHFNGDPIDPATLDWRTVDPKKVLFKQDPGPWNALGLVRINMPNPEIVYLHDTPMKDLFSQALRPFSAGCVRVQDVMDFVGWIARHEPGFSDPNTAIQQILDAGEPVDIQLTRPLPVYFTYITAWAEADGTLAFRPDIYGRDGAEALRGARDEDAPAVPEMLSP